MRKKPNASIFGKITTKHSALKCTACGYEGFDFKIRKHQYTFCVGKWIDDHSLHPTHRLLEQEYERKNARLVLVCPHCLSPLQSKEEQKEWSL